VPRGRARRGFEGRGLKDGFGSAMMPGHCMANPRVFLLAFAFAFAFALAALGAITQASSAEEFTAFLKKDAERWARVIKAAGVKEE
jgi:hypothetical protein